MLQLRDYQEKALNAVLQEWENGHRKTLVVMPTGTGKTVLFAAVANKCVDKNRVLILAHRSELLEQASDKLMKTCGLETVTEKAGCTSLNSPIQITVGSLQTMQREERLDQFPQDYFKTIIIDEAHHSMSDSYQRILSYFYDANVLGVTATPDRGDMRNLDNFFDSMAFEYTMAEAIKSGYLCPVSAQMIPLSLDLSGVKIYSGDYAAGEIGNALEPYLDQIAREMADRCKDRKTVVFLPLISTSQKFCKILQNYGFRVTEVNGKSKDREEKIAAFVEGTYNVLCNSMLLTEGWDCPSVDCVVVLRPTKSRSLYQQMVGRGMRPAEGKKDLLILDFLWLTTKHDICRPSSLISKEKEVAEKIDKYIAEDSSALNLVECEKRATNEILAQREQSLASNLKQMQDKNKKTIDPVLFAFSIAEEDLAEYKPTFKWERDNPTEKQLSYLSKLGIEASKVTCKGYASMLIDKLQARRLAGLSTPKQIRLLENYGFRHAGMWKFDKASEMIQEIANNGWRLPYRINEESGEILR